MKLFRRKKPTESSDIPADLQPYYSGSQSGARKWLGFAVRIVLLLVVLVLLVWGGVWLVHKFTNRNSSNTSSKTNSSQQATTKDSGNATTNKPSTGSSSNGSSNPSTSGSTNGSSSSTSQGSSPTTPSTAPAQSTTDQSAAAGQPSALTNTGPGETIAVAFAVALAGVVASYVWTLRKLRN